LWLWSRCSVEPSLGCWASLIDKKQCASPKLPLSTNPFHLGFMEKDASAAAIRHLMFPRERGSGIGMLRQPNARPLGTLVP
jgi:hypothetical protein